MHNEAHKILFAFSPDLDSDFLKDLYGEDLQQAEAVFESSVQQLRNELLLAQARFHAGDTAGLKKVVHKMKPLFGYIGLNEIMQQFAAFEEVCVKATSITETEKGFNDITSITEQAIQKIEKETRRLKQFNTQYL
ncbi:MAG: hypothetical protein KF746_17920 [Chitinophagaceae bacterium]|nr:hypothetical protein [Chitinophagaceae bacterium]